MAKTFFDKLFEEINSQTCSVLRCGVYTTLKWRQIRVGDIINIGLNDVIPADCLLIGSSNKDPICFIETANLDGETNLKQKDVIHIPDSQVSSRISSIDGDIVHEDQHFKLGCER